MSKFVNDVLNAHGNKFMDLEIFTGQYNTTDGGVYSGWRWKTTSYAVNPPLCLEGYLDGSTLRLFDRNEVGTLISFTLDLKPKGKFKIQFTKSGTFDCEVKPESDLTIPMTPLNDTTQIQKPPLPPSHAPVPNKSSQNNYDWEKAKRDSDAIRRLPNN